MSKLAKILIPLIADKTTKNDYTEDAGFIDLYTFDMDKYKNYKGIYLMFKSNISTDASKTRSINLSRQPGIISVHTKIINGNPFIIYSFAKSELVKKITDSNICTLDSNSLKTILKFWGIDDKFVDYILSNCGCLTYNREKIIPETDTQKTLVEYLHEGITYNKREAA